MAQGPESVGGGEVCPMCPMPPRGGEAPPPSPTKGRGSAKAARPVSTAFLSCLDTRSCLPLLPGYPLAETSPTFTPSPHCPTKPHLSSPGWFLGGTGPLRILPIPSETSAHFHLSPRPRPSTLDAAISPRKLASLLQCRGAPHLQFGRCSYPAPRPLLPQACPCPEVRTPARGSGSWRLPFLTAAFSGTRPACPPLLCGQPGSAQQKCPNLCPTIRHLRKQLEGRAGEGLEVGRLISCVMWTHLWP